MLVYFWRYIPGTEMGRVMDAMVVPDGTLVSDVLESLSASSLKFERTTDDFRDCRGEEMLGEKGSYLIVSDDLRVTANAFLRSGRTMLDIEAAVNRRRLNRLDEPENFDFAYRTSHR